MCPWYTQPNEVYKMFTFLDLPKRLGRSKTYSSKCLVKNGDMVKSRTYSETNQSI